jgi:hypothetical protein
MPPPGPRSTPAFAITEFVKRARSILWREDVHRKDKKKPSYDRWTQTVEDLKSGSGYTYHQAVVQASKDYMCLRRLFREYDVQKYDPNPDSHPDIYHFGDANEPLDPVVNEGLNLSYRENLNWALAAAGEFLRKGSSPSSCPNDQAYYLYVQATESPKEFMQRLGQVESKGDSELDANRAMRGEAKRSINEIEEMLDTLGGNKDENPIDEHDF